MHNNWQRKCTALHFSGNNRTQSLLSSPLFNSIGFSIWDRTTYACKLFWWGNSKQLRWLSDFFLISQLLEFLAFSNKPVCHFKGNCSLAVEYFEKWSWKLNTYRRPTGSPLSFLTSTSLGQRALQKEKTVMNVVLYSHCGHLHLITQCYISNVCTWDVLLE